MKKKKSFKLLGECFEKLVRPELSLCSVSHLVEVFG